MLKMAYPLLVLLLLCSCNDESEVKVYRIAKTNPMNSKKIAWQTPPSWQELPASGMRQGSFLVNGLTKDQVDVSVTFLAGDAGGDLPNVNRWRDQIELPAWSLSELDENIQLVEASSGKVKVVDFSNNKNAKRIIAAIITQDSGIWFFKMIGEEKHIASQKRIFLEFLYSLH